MFRHFPGVVSLACRVPPRPGNQLDMIEELTDLDEDHCRESSRSHSGTRESDSLPPTKNISTGVTPQQRPVRRTHPLFHRSKGIRFSQGGGGHGTRGGTKGPRWS